MDPLRGHDEPIAAAGGPALRVFFAVELAPSARAAAGRVAERLREAGALPVRWVKPENLHVTLRFLGAVAAGRIGGLVERVTSEIAALRPFTLRLGAVQVFPSPRRPRVVALGLTPEAALSRLAGAVERGVVAAGLPPEDRPFRAHLTLGRLAPRTRLRDLPPPLADPAAAAGVTAVDTPAGEASDVTEVVLMHSQLERSGSRYTPLAHIPLASAGRAGPSAP